MKRFASFLCILSISGMLFAESADVRYAYGQLSAGEKKWYEAIEEAILDVKADVPDIPYPFETVKKIFNALMTDCPEFFYVKESFSCDVFTSGKCTLHPDYWITDKNKIVQRRKEINKAALALIKSARADNDGEFVKAVFDSLCLDTTYNESFDDQSMYSVFTVHEGVCAGYTRAFQYVMQQMGYPSLYVRGEAFDGQRWGRHAWNMVKLGDDWYYVDPTFADTDQGTWVDHAYLLMTTKQMREDHRPDETYVKLPSCTSTKFRYLQKE